MTQRIGILHGSMLVSDEDFDWVDAKPWHLGDTGYVKGYRSNGKSPYRLHRLIMERVLGRKLNSTELVDHINGNRLDNRRENLRLADKSTNAMNRGNIYGKSRYLGVAWHG